MAQVVLPPPPLHEVAPEDEAAQGREPREVEPFASNGVGDTRECRELFGIECLIELPLSHDILDLHSGELFLPFHCLDAERGQVGRIRWVKILPSPNQIGLGIRVDLTGHSASLEGMASPKALNGFLRIRSERTLSGNAA